MDGKKSLGKIFSAYTYPVVPKPEPLSTNSGEPLPPNRIHYVWATKNRNLNFKNKKTTMNQNGNEKRFKRNNDNIGNTICFLDSCHPYLNLARTIIYLLFFVLNKNRNKLEY